MSETIGSATIEVGVNSSAAEAGMNRIDSAIGRTGRNLDNLGGRGAENMGRVGAGADAAAKRVDAATRNIAGAVERANAALISGKKSGAEYFEELARSRGADVMKLAPLIAQLRETEAAQARAKAALEATAASQVAAAEAARVQAAALREVAQVQSVRDNFVGNLREQIQLFGKSADEVLRYRAAQAGAAGAAEPLILELRQLRDAQDAATEAARRAATAQQQAAQRQASGEAMLANLREQIALQGKSAEEVLRYRAALAGTGTEAEVLIQQLQRMKAGQDAAAEAARVLATARQQAAQTQATGEAFLANLREQALLYGKSADEVLRYRAGQLGLAGAAAPLLAQLQSVKMAQDAVAAAARSSAEAQRQAAQAQAGKDNFVASLQQQAAAIGKTRTELLELQAAQMGVSNQAAPFIQKLREAEQGLNNAGMSARANAAALRGVPAQFTDIIVSLQGGQAPLTVLLQQGGQLKDMFGGAGNAAKALGGYVLSLINPFTIAAAAAAVLGVAYYQGTAEAKAFALSIATTGNVAGVTAGQLSDMAKEASQAAGTQGKNAEVINQLIGTGKVAADQLVAASVTAVRSQKFLGVEVENTVKAYAELGAEPVKASLKLNEQYNYLTLSVYKQIKALEDQGRVLEAGQLAQQTYDAGMAKSIGEVEAKLGSLQKAWNSTAEFAKKAWDAMLGIGRKDTLDEQLAEAEQRVASAKRAFFNFGGDDSIKRERLAAAETARDALKAQRDGASAAAKKEGDDQRRNKAAIEFAEQNEKYLTREEQMNREIAKARTLRTAAAPVGENAAATEEAIQKRIAQIRSKYVDVNNAGIALQIGAVQRLGEVQEEVAKRARISLDMQQQAGDFQALDKRIAYAEAVAKMDEEAIRREKSRAQQRLAITATETVSADQQGAQQEKLAVLRGQISKADQEILTRHAELSKEVSAMELADSRAALDALDKLSEARFSEATSLEGQLQAQRDANAVIGLSAEKAAAYNRNLVEEAAVRKEVEASLLANIPSRAAEADALNRSAAAMRDLADARRAGEIKADQFKDSTESAKKLLDILTAVDTAAKSAAQGMADSFGSVGKAIGGLTTALTDYAVQQQTVAAQLAAVKSDPKSSADKIAKAEMAASKASAQAQIKSYGDMASAGKSFFKENSKGYKAMETAEKAFRAYEMAMAVESMVKKIFFKEGEVAANLALNATKLTGEAATTAASTGLAATEASAWGITAVVKAMASLPFPLNLAAGAATLAAVIAIGAKMFGGVGGGGLSVSQQRQESQGTGTVFGDSTAKSDSIKRSLELAATNSSIELTYTRSMLLSLRGIESSLGGLGNLLIRNSGLTGEMASGSQGAAANFLTSTAGTVLLTGMFAPLVMAADKLLGGTISKWTASISNAVFGGKKTVQDTGFTIDRTTLAAALTGNVSSFQYADIKKDGGLFHSDKTSTDKVTLGIEANAQFAKVIAGLGSSVSEAAKLLGVGGDAFTQRLNTFVIDIGKISLKDLSGDEIQKQLEAVFSKLGDDMAKFGVAGLDQFQQVGEGYFETLTRIATNYANLDSILASSGTSFGQVGMASIAARERLIALAGGIDDLASQQTSFNDNFLTEAERLAPVQKYVTDQLAALGLQSLDTRDKFKEYVLELANGGALATEAGAAQYTALLALADAFAKTHAATEDLTKSEQEIADERKDLLQQLDEITKSEAELLAIQRAGIADVNKALFDQVQAAKAVVSAKDALATAYDKEATATKAAIEKSKAWVTTLNGLNPSLAQGNLSALTPEQKYAEARAQFEKTLAAANAGDTTAQSGLSAAEQAFLTASQVVNASDAKYAADYARVVAANEEAIKWATVQVDLQQASYDALEAQVKSLITINDSVLTVAQAIANLQTAIGMSDGLGVKFTEAPVVTAMVASAAPAVDYSRYSAASNAGSDALIAEIRGLREDNKVLQEKVEKQTAVLARVTAESNAKAAETVVDGVEKSAKASAWSSTVKGEYA